MKSPVTIRFSPLLLLAALLFALASSSAYAAATFQAAGTAVGGTGSVSPAWPAHAVDDIALLFVESTGGEAVTLSTPAGFAAVANSPQFTGTGTAGTRISVFWARATSTAMGAPTVADPGNHVYAQIITYRGVVDTGNPWDVTIGGNKGTASTTVTVTGVTTTVANALIVQVASQDIDATGAAFSAQANATLTGIAERSDAGTNANNGGGFAVWDGTKATAGATGNTTATVTSSVNAFMTIALKPQLPAVSSINRASTNPAYADDTVSWTVVFNMAVTGVDATDFALVPGGGLSGASISSVTGSGTTWTVTASPGGTNAGTLGLNLIDDDSIVNSGVPLGGSGAGNGNFTGEVYTITTPFCAPPSNIPAGVTVSCVCDRFGRASLNPSTIYGSNWIVSTSDSTGIVPYINGTSGLLRLTENTGNNAKAATVPGIFPAAGNYISVEFQHYAYSGSGADGIAVTLSDYSVSAVPGAFGGSLGYAQKTPPAVAANVPGFAGGWIGVGIDEFGNYQNPSEGRIGGPGARADSIGVRGSGSGVTGYNWIAGTATLAPGIDNTASATPAPGAYYQVIVDARNASNATPQTFVSVSRDTSGSGTAYTSLIASFDVFAANPSQAAVPSNWQISFTGSTGGSTNIHEIGGLRICAQSVAPPTGGTASGFSAIDEAYPAAPTIPAYQNFQTGHIYTKLQGTSFKLWVAALTGTGISSAYSAVSAKYAQVKLVDNSASAGNLCGSDAARTCNAACTNAASVETGATQIVPFVLGGPGASLSPSFTLNSAWQNLVAVVKECTTSACMAFTATTPACSVDSLSVRPTGATGVTVATPAPGTAGSAAYSSPSGAPVLAAGSGNFQLTATVPGVAGNPNRYTGVLKIAASPSPGIEAIKPSTGVPTVGSVSPATFPAAVSGTPNSTATGSTFTYSEVGAFRLRGYLPASDSSSDRGVYDGVSATECASLTTAACDALKAATWTGVDSISSKNDCVAFSYSNTKDGAGKYGCNFGLTADTANLGRFQPAYFSVTRTFACPDPTPIPTDDSFTYSGQPFTAGVTAYSGAGNVTKNYDHDVGFAKTVTLSLAGATANFTNNLFDGSVGLKFAQGLASRTDVKYTFPVKETAPLVPSVLPAPPATPLRAADDDNPVVSSATGTEPQLSVRSGRIVIQSAFGSELVDLAVPMRAQYYVSSTNGWVTNTEDVCTAVTLVFSNYQGNLAAGETCVQDSGNPGLSGLGCAAAGPLIPTNERFREAATLSGDFNLYLKAPGSGNDGSVDISTDLAAMSWLQYDWDGNGTPDNNPQGRATFGIYKGSPRHIYIRERY